MPAPRGRRFPDESLERSGKRRFGLVADLRPNSSTVHSFAGASCISASARPTNRSRNPASQPRLSSGDVAAHRIDEHHLAHPFEHRFATRPLVLRLRFGHRLAHELGDPVGVSARSEMQESRQRRISGLKGRTSQPRNPQTSAVSQLSDAKQQKRPCARSARMDVELSVVRVELRSFRAAR